MRLLGYSIRLSIFLATLSQPLTAAGFSSLTLSIPVTEHSLTNYTNASTTAAAHPQMTEAERNRALAKQQFTDNFRKLQLLSQGLLKEHEQGKLTAAQLAKSVKAINKSAKNLRTLMALGSLASPPKGIIAPTAPQDFNQAIRRLAKLIYDFAHSPVHQNNKVFNTAEAARAQTGLLTIIQLAKVLGDQAKNYASFPSSSQ